MQPHARTEIDRDHSEITALRGHGADEPGAARLVIHDGAWLQIRAGAQSRDNGILHHRPRMCLRTAIRRLAFSGCGAEQHHAAADQERKMLLDRVIDAGSILRGCEPARKGIKRTVFTFSAIGALGLDSKPGREMSGHYRDQKEENEINDLHGIFDPEVEDRFVEEEGGRGSCRDSGNDRLNHSPADRGN